MSIKELPPAAWVTIWRWTGINTAITLACSVLGASVLMSAFGPGLSAAGLGVAIVLPLLLGAPLSFSHLVRLQQLKQANERLQLLASTDWLTECLNRRAFTHSVSSRLAATAEARPTRGALLVIDADHFKVINDLYGHDRGDEALYMMAAIIRSKVRECDLVCRMGGEEFGVFLDDADRDTAALIAERIRKGINRIDFVPDGVAHQLSVSIGGAVFDGGIEFSGLFRVADQNLYVAKQAGRNRTEIGIAEARPEPVDRPGGRQDRLYLAGAN